MDECNGNGECALCALLVVQRDSSSRSLQSHDIICPQNGRYQIFASHLYSTFCKLFASVLSSLRGLCFAFTFLLLWLCTLLWLRCAWKTSERGEHSSV